MRWGLIVLATFGAAASGCAAPPPEDPGPAHAVTEPGAAAAVWPFWPTRMRLHPLSRLVTDAATGQTIIEARLELFDDTGDTIKGVGLVRIDLHAVPPLDGKGRTSDVAPVATWNRDLRDLPVNARHFDDVTRTYLFRLEVEEAQLPEAAELRAYFASTDGRLLQADLALRMR